VALDRNSDVRYRDASPPARSIGVPLCHLGLGLGGGFDPPCDMIATGILDQEDCKVEGRTRRDVSFV
jgi:hypothetical protein